MSDTAAPPGVTEQVRLYGRALGERFDDLTAAYRITRGRLAEALGLSPAMLSQLASGQRIKISNPTVHARLLKLEELAGTVSDESSAAAALDSLRSDTPELTTRPRSMEPTALLAKLLAEQVPLPELQTNAETAVGVLQTRLREAVRLAQSASERRNS